MFDNISVLLSFLICLFAIGSWISLNGLWIELPLLINHLPEAWKLPTYVVTIVQLANIAPMIYMGIHYSGKCKNLERYTIYFILTMGCICCALLSLFWHHTINIYIFGQWYQKSVVFFILVLLLSMVDTTSSVTFLPYLVNYPRHYITMLFVGEGLSGLLPAIAGLIQGIGSKPFCRNKTTVINGTNHTSEIPVFPFTKFSISSFFLFLSGLMIVCLISFILIDNSRCFHKFPMINKHEKLLESLNVQDEKDDDEYNEYSPFMETDILLSRTPEVSSKGKWVFYVLLIGFINFFTNGILPSIQIYTLMPYSNKLYHLVVILSQIFNPLACLLTIHDWKITRKTIIVLSTIGSIGTGYLIFLASKSPFAVLNNGSFGQILAAFCWFVVSTVFSFEKTCLAIEIQKQGHFWLQICGTATQIGSTLGAVSIFVLVSVFELFKSKHMIC